VQSKFVNIKLADFSMQQANSFDATSFVGPHQSKQLIATGAAAFAQPLQPC
jgi:hypothetical protein